MKRAVAVTAAIAALAVGGLGAAATADGPKKGDTGWGNALTPEKETLEAADRAYDAANQAAAADGKSQAAIAQQKAAEHAQHRAELAQAEGPMEPWPTGIFEDAEAPASGSYFLGTNRWVGPAGQGEFQGVYAGRSGEDATVGRVMAVWSNPSRPGYTLDLPGVGALRIVDAQGAILTIQDEVGGTHVLNAQSGTWLQQ